MIVPASQIDPSLWPAILHERHSDWPWPLSLVYRWRTAYFGDPPRKVDGNAIEYEFWYRQVRSAGSDDWIWVRCAVIDEGAVLFRHPLPIPEPGQWWRGEPDFYASKTESGWYTRNGYRWDDIDAYYQKPSFTVKKWEV